jgi:hypothetical protein
MDEKQKALLSLVILGIAVLIFWPFVFIWSVNTLFQTSIEYNLKNWFATVLLMITFRGNFSKAK